MFSFLALLGDVNPSAPESSKVVLFNPTERMGVIIMAVAGVTSCTLVSILLLYIIGSALVLWSRKTQDRSGLFISKQIAIFLTCLLVSDLIQSISGITQVKWAIENQIYESRSCTIQAVTLVMGDLGSTVWSITIAAHTFTGIALGKHWPRWLVWTTVCTGWTFVIVLTVLVPLGLVETKRGPFFSIAGTWCFISSEYAVPRLVIHYVPLFVASALIIIFYGLIFRFLRRSAGFLRPQGSLPAVNDVLSRQRVAIAKRMLWYPVAFLTCIMPIAITRITGFQEETVPEAVWIVGMFFLFALGAVDSVIYATTRRVIKPINLPFHMMATPGSDNSNARIVDIERADTREKASNNELMFEYSVHRDQDGFKFEGARRVGLEGGIMVTREQIQEVM